MPRFNFGNRNGDNGENNTNRANHSNTSVREEYEAPEGYSDYVSGEDEYREVLGELWKLMICCIIGWIVACVGFVTDNMLFVLLGVLIVDIPAIRIVLAGGSIAALFGSYIGATRIVKYSDGSEREDNSAAAGGFAVGIFIFLIALVVGIISIVIRIFKAFFTLLRIKNENGIKTETKNAPWLPIVVGLAVFAVGAIVSSVAGEIRSGDLFADLKESDYSDTEEAEMLTEVLDNMYLGNFGYNIWEDEEIIKVSYAAATRIYTFTVSEYGASRIGLASGTYQALVNADGSISYEETLSNENALVLHSFTLSKLVNIDVILADLGNCAIKGSGGEFKCYYHKTTEMGADYTYFRLIDRNYGSGTLEINLVEDPMTVNIQNFDGSISFEVVHPS